MFCGLFHENAGNPIDQAGGGSNLAAAVRNVRGLGWVMPWSPRLSLVCLKQGKKHTLVGLLWCVILRFPLFKSLQPNIL